MSDISSVSEGYATNQEIRPIVQKIEAALGDVPRTHALIALTSIILMIQHPDITPQQIYQGIHDVSKYICMWLAGTTGESDDTPVEKAKMN